jgi:hypothetical protein
LRGMHAVNVDENMIEDMLNTKFLNPMLGIYGAHLVVLQNAPDSKDVIREVLPNLQKLVGELPDVTCLRLYLDDPSALTLSYPFPPMLLASWSIIVKNCPTQNNLVPAKSFSASIAGSLWGSGAWLGWKLPETAAAPSFEEVADVDWGLLKKIAGDDGPPTSTSDLNPVERAVMSFVQTSGKRYSLISTEASPPGSDSEVALQPTPETITAATGIPYSVILDVAASLTKRFK